MKQVEAVILETNAELCVLGKEFRGLDAEVLERIQAPKRRGRRR